MRDIERGIGREREGETGKEGKMGRKRGERGREGDREI